MAVSTIADDKKKALNLAIAQIEKSCGKGSIMRMDEKEKVRVEAVPTGAINLDAAIGVGGIPRGRVTEIYGPESSGKTTLCLHVVANAQKMGGVAAFIDAEHVLDVEYARKLGFEPHADYGRAAGYLGAWDGECELTFGRDGKPMYIFGPHDDGEKIIRKLRRRLGDGNYDFVHVTSG